MAITIKLKDLSKELQASIKREVSLRQLQDLIAKGASEDDRYYFDSLEDLAGNLVDDLYPRVKSEIEFLDHDEKVKLQAEPYNAYEVLKKKTNEKQDELEESSEILYLSNKSFKGYEDYSGLSLTKEDYSRMLDELEKQFDTLEIGSFAMKPILFTTVAT